MKQSLIKTFDIVLNVATCAYDGGRFWLEPQPYLTFV